MSNRSDQDIKKMVSSMKKRKIDPVVTYLNHGRLIRPHTFESIHDLCYVDFVSFEQQLNTNQINPLFRVNHKVDFSYLQKRIEFDLNSSCISFNC